MCRPGGREGGDPAARGQVGRGEPNFKRPEVFEGRTEGGPDPTGPGPASPHPPLGPLRCLYSTRPAKFTLAFGPYPGVCAPSRPCRSEDFFWPEPFRRAHPGRRRQTGGPSPLYRAPGLVGGVGRRPESCRCPGALPSLAPQDSAPGPRPNSRVHSHFYTSPFFTKAKRNQFFILVSLEGRFVIRTRPTALIIRTREAVEGPAPPPRSDDPGAPPLSASTHQDPGRRGKTEPSTTTGKPLDHGDDPRGDPLFQLT